MYQDWEVPEDVDVDSINAHVEKLMHKAQVISVKAGDYITCPYPTTAFIKCRYLICIDNMSTYPSRCPSCGRGV